MSTSPFSSFDAKTRPSEQVTGIVDLGLVAVQRAHRRAGRAPSLAVVLAAVARAGEAAPVSSTGQPRCMQVFEMTVKVSSAFFRTNTTRRSMPEASFGSRSKVTTVYLSPTG